MLSSEYTEYTVNECIGPADKQTATCHRHIPALPSPHRVHKTHTSYTRPGLACLLVCCYLLHHHGRMSGLRRQQANLTGAVSTTRTTHTFQNTQQLCLRTHNTTWAAS